MDPALLSFLMDLWRLVQAAGAVLCVVFAYLWRLERAERIECQRAKTAMVEEHRKEKEAVTDRAVNAINSVANVVQGLKDIVQAGKAHP